MLRPANSTSTTVRTTSPDGLNPINGKGGPLARPFHVLGRIQTRDPAAKATGLTPKASQQSQNGAWI